MTGRPLMMFVFAWMCWLPAMALAGPNQTTETLARELLTVTKFSEQFTEQLSVELAKAPGLPSGFLDKFMKEAQPHLLVERIVPVYAKEYDEATLRAAIAFYKTPEGQKVVEKQLTITSSITAIGQQWGMEKAQEVLSSMGIQAPPQ